MYQPYVATHKKWDHVGNLTPNVEISEGIRPAEELKPASYLKLVRFDKYLEDYFVVSAGKVVALDGNNDVVPAGLKLQADAFVALWAAGYAATAGTIQDILDWIRTPANWAGTTYTAYDSVDVQQGIIDINAPVVSNAAGNAVTVSELVVESFFTVVLTAGPTTINISNLTPGDAKGLLDSDVATQALSVSFPIGIAPFNYFRWAGGDGFNPFNYNLHNYNMQRS